MAYPSDRLRRLRRLRAFRNMVRETRVHRSDLILPLFVVEGTGIVEEVPSMPGVMRFSPDRLPGEIEQIASLGLQAVILFGIPAEKDETGTSALKENGVVQEAIRVIKKTAPELVVITDVCLCEYTSHGHCGVVRDKEVENDATIERISLMALSHAKAGADMVAPSDMMDGRVQAIRLVLDENSLTRVPIMSYAAKFSSAFYGPFRDSGL